jgi:AcrR family transcriptional regulator
MKSGTADASTRGYRMTARAMAAEATASRVLEVAVELFSEKPFEDVTLGEVAERAGVTPRTVIRRFGSKEALFVEAMGRAGEEAERERNAAPVGDVAEAVRQLVLQYESWGTNRLRMLSQEDRIPVVAENVEHGRRYHWSWVERTFAPLLVGLRGRDRRRRKAALIAATDVYTWKLLRRDLALSRSDTERTIVELIGNIAVGK